MKLPKWGLSDGLKNSPYTPKWLIDEEEFENKNPRLKFMEDSIKISQNLSNSRQDVKIF